MWNCPVCDTLNNEQYSKCEVCKTPRPSTPQVYSAKSIAETRSSKATQPTPSRERKIVAHSNVVSPPLLIKKETQDINGRAFPYNKSLRYLLRAIFLLAVTLCIFIMYVAGNQISSVIRDPNVNATKDLSTPTFGSNPDNTGSQPIATIQATDVTLLDPSVCSEIDQVRVRDTAKGDILTIYCSNSVSYKLDPLAKGKYEISSNRKFMVYVTFGGDVYATKAGNRYLIKIGQFIEFYMIQIHGMLELDISIDGDDPYYVNVFEKNMKERKMFLIPKDIAR